ncbi:MAG: hydrogenase maturation nickel metallochaperone HypA [Alphaproteobacteria bacterium]|nr:hydrogenase maturation nickel metallochaperone HypA [Alphaproteobacteria bacterium]MBV9554654.1 hydrogenase maturation nickel metallochaperone HypA [Alphaproteobacteria bacterium]
MHELAVTCSIVRHVVRAARGRTVRAITLEIGQLCGVRPEGVAFCFPEIARGTSAAAARLDIRRIAGRGYCESCHSEVPIAERTAPCPCGSSRVHTVAGEELTLKSIAFEYIP